MGAKETSSSLRCEITIIQAKNIQLKSHGTFFVRYYLSAPNNKRIQINTKQISSKSNLVWNESNSVECLGTQETVNSLKEDSIVMELRWRSNSTNLFRRSSKLVGSAQIPWRSVFESPNMQMEKWVNMVSNQKMNRTSVFDESIQLPSVQICMSVRMPAQLTVEKKRINRSQQYECTHDSGYCRCQDYEILALVGAFESAL
ncbi:uncharacterized protein [Euphorbia lathyris]|uniref:uncharacterized protein n=1 Tax=Euphorbia lathyris TaxID=212925 RepID=UPI003313EEC4